MDLAGLIGRGNALPWRLPADMKHFRKLTLNKTVLMGRRTFESIGKALPNRTNLVLSTDASFAPEGCECFGTLDAALARAGELGAEAMVIGGAKVYEATLPRATALELTIVGARFDGDTWFPPVAAAAWRTASYEPCAIDEANRWPFAFARLERVTPAGADGGALDWATVGR